MESTGGYTAIAVDNGAGDVAGFLSVGKHDVGASECEWLRGDVMQRNVRVGLLPAVDTVGELTGLEAQGYWAA